MRCSVAATPGRRRMTEFFLPTSGHFVNGRHEFIGAARGRAATPYVASDLRERPIDLKYWACATQAKPMTVQGPWHQIDMAFAT